MKENENIRNTHLPMSIDECDQMIIEIELGSIDKIKSLIDKEKDKFVREQLEQLYYAQRILVDRDFTIYSLLKENQISFRTPISYNLKEDTKVITTKKRNFKINKLLMYLMNNNGFTAQDRIEETGLALDDLFKQGMCKWTERIEQLLKDTGIKVKTNILLSLKNKLKKIYHKARLSFQIWLKKCKSIVSLSLGKDSTAMLVRLIEEGVKIDRIIFADTEKEFEEIYKYKARVEEYIGRKIESIKPKNTWDQWFYGKYTKGKREGQIRGFPFTVGFGCWAKRELKLKGLKEAMGKGNKIYIGIAVDEKERCSREEYKRDNIYKFPLVEWGMTEEQCIEFLEKRDLHNPLYDRFERLGCWCCPKQSLKSLKTLYKYYPEKWKQLLQYEKDSPIGFSPNKNLRMLERRFEIEIALNERQINMFDLAVCR